MPQVTWHLGNYGLLDNNVLLVPRCVLSSFPQESTAASGDEQDDNGASTKEFSGDGPDTSATRGYSSHAAPAVQHGSSTPPLPARVASSSQKTANVGATLCAMNISFLKQVTM